MRLAETTKCPLSPAARAYSPWALVSAAATRPPLGRDAPGDAPARSSDTTTPAKGTLLASSRTVPRTTCARATDENVASSTIADNRNITPRSPKPNVLITEPSSGMPKLEVATASDGCLAMLAVPRPFLPTHAAGGTAVRLTLPESSPRRSRPAGGTVLSAVLHAGVIGATVAGTALSAPRPAPPEPLEKLVFVKPWKEDHPSLPPAPPPPHSVTPPTGTPPLVPPTIVAPPDIAVDPTFIPTRLPDLDAVLGAIPQGRTDVGTTTSSSAADGGGVNAGGVGEPLTALTVDEEVVVRDAATPRYPSILARAGVEGVVLARFVVDTLGRVERGSIVLESASNPLFGESVREALGRMRFVPARARGRAVRQLVQQPFTFAIANR